MKIFKGDKVKITVGKDRGRVGKVEKIYKRQNKVLILGINIYKKHIKKSEQMPKGGVAEVPRPIDVAKIMLICPTCGKITRVGFKLEKSRKSRICKKCNANF
jgi:large subunit ribosomal protein L24